MPSLNLLKSKIPICVCVCVWAGGGGSRNLMSSLNLLKSKIPMCVCVGGGGGLHGIDAEFKFAKIQNSHLWGGGGWGVRGI